MIILTQSFTAYDLGRLTAIILIAIGIIKLVKYANGRSNNKYTNSNEIIKKNEISETSNITIEYSKSYEPKYLMTLNEKAQFRKLQAWAQSRGFIVLSKVRLLDLITPRTGQNNYKGLLWKIQAKHVDFVICDKDIRIKCIIEISDNSHKRADRSERDRFVADVLTACGYKVLQTYNVTNEQLDQICNINQSAADEQNQP